MNNNTMIDTKTLLFNLESDIKNHQIRYIHTYHDKKAGEWHFIFYGNENTYTKVTLQPSSFTHEISKITNQERIDTVTKWSHSNGDFCCYEGSEEISGIYSVIKKLI